MNGWEVPGRLLGDPRTAGVPVVMMSSESQLPAIARKLGVEVCFPKPFERDDLVRIVRQYTVAA